MHSLCVLLLSISLFQFAASDSTASTSTTAAPDVTVKNLKLFYGGTQFIIKGMAYSPSPIGYGNNTGLCSYHDTPYGGWMSFQSACYDEDFFDGGTYPMDSQPAGGWFMPLWQRDLPLIAGMGANTLRVYHANPITRAASQQYNGSYGIVAPWGKDHVPFFDYAYSLGLKIIWPLLGDDDPLLTYSDEEMQWMYERQIEEVGNHPALLMYAIGNELNWIGNYSTWQYVLQRINTLAAYARQYQLTTWNRSIPITTGTDDNEDYYVMLMETLSNFDILSPNAGYRGPTFTNLWSGAGWPGQAIFPGFFNMSCYYQRPIMIGEMNPYGYDNPAPDAYVPGGFPSQWSDLLNHVSQGALGGVFFEWSNEDWKAVGNQSNLGLVATQVVCNATGSCSTDVDVWLVDSVTNKTWLYGQVCCGTWDDYGNITGNTQYNFGEDPFLLLGYEPEQLATASQPCPLDMIGPEFLSEQTPQTNAASGARPSASSSAATHSSSSHTAAASPGTSETVPPHMLPTADATMTGAAPVVLIPMFSLPVLIAILAVVWRLS